MKTNDCRFLPKPAKDRETRYAEELAEKLNNMGAIITAADLLAIRAAFERHFREVQQHTIAAMEAK